MYAIRLARRFSEDAIYGISHVRRPPIPPRDQISRRLSARYHPHSHPFPPSLTKTPEMIRTKRRRQRDPDVVESWPAPPGSPRNTTTPVATRHPPRTTRDGFPSPHRLRATDNPIVSSNPSSKIREGGNTTIIVDVPRLEEQVREIRRPPE
jgi:hypothetical protein